MKIQLTNDEFYEIKMPEQIGMQEFKCIVMKFNFLLKNFSKFDIGNENTDDDIVLKENQRINNRDVERWKILKDNRNIFVELLKTYYLKSQNELDKLFEKYNVSFRRTEFSSTQMIRLRELHNLNPNEIGLKQFPTKTIQLMSCILNKNTDGETENE